MTAKYSAQKRFEIIKRVLENNEPVAHVCQRFGISRTLFYRWLKRYRQVSENDRQKALAPLKREVIYFPGQTTPQLVQRILRVVKKNPEYSANRISALFAEIEGKSVISNHAVQNVFRRLDLNTIYKREKFAQGRSRLPPLFRKQMIERVLKGKESVARVCQDYGISRTAFYRWLSRYKKSGMSLSSLTDQTPKVKRYWRQLGVDQEKEILGLIVKHPEYSSHKLASILSWVGNHGIQNVLKRNGLNTYDKRLVYSQSASRQAAVTPAFGLPVRIKRFLAGIPNLLAIPPPIKPFFFSLFGSIPFFLLIIWWLNLINTTPTISAKIGLIFATLSLGIGSIFFAYSMKYYLTLAIVLSFSREAGSDSTDKNTQPFAKSWVNGRTSISFGFLSLLSRIFGIEITNDRFNNSTPGVSADFTPGVSGGNGARKGLGLEPDLSSITLERHPFVSIHLPMYNEKRVVERLLKACTQMEYPSTRSARSGQACFEIIVIDDSTDETTAIVRKFAQQWNNQFSIPNLQSNPNSQFSNKKDKNTCGPFIKVIHRSSRKGFKGSALKEALKASSPKTEFVVVFDADFVPYPDTLTQFVKYFQLTAGVNSGDSNIAAVGGYQWHVLNKSENWITRGVRTEYAGSYVIERAGREIMGLLKQVSGSVYMIRKDVLEKVGWGTSITEDFQLTLKLYEQGYKVVYTPYIQAPAECVSTLKRLIRQRMRWAEGHSNNIRRMFMRLMFGRWVAGETSQRQTSSKVAWPKASDSLEVSYQESIPYSDGTNRTSRSDRTDGKQFIPSPLTLPEKLELLYISPYYLQAAFFLIGTIAWILAELVFRVRLPFWTALWGWSLVLTNLIALPLLNAVGLFLEESEEKDYLGLVSFIILSYILVPFQAYASVKGFLEKEEGTWFRTPKTGRVTDIFKRGTFYRWISGILPGWGGSSLAASMAGRAALAYQRQTTSEVSAYFPTSSRLGRGRVTSEVNGRGSSPYLALATANNRFNRFRLSRRRWKGFTATILVILVVCSSTLFRFLPAVSQSKIPFAQAQGKLGIESDKNTSEVKDPDTSEVNQESEERAEGSPASSPEQGRMDSPSQPQITLTDNRKQGQDSPGVAGPIGEGSASNLTVRQTSPEETPEEFYLVAEDKDMAKDTSFSNFLSWLKDRLSLPAFAQDSENDKTTSEVPDPGSNGEVKYIPYRLTKHDDIYEVETRSEAGIQKIVMEKNSMEIKLYEKAKDSDFILKATSIPIFEYASADSNSDWQEYLPLIPGQLSSEDYEDYTIIKQEFTLVSTPDFGSLLTEVQATIELKIGFDGQSPINKLTFKLGENENVNRVKWETQLEDSPGGNTFNLYEEHNPELDDLFSACFLGVPVTSQKLGNVEVDWLDFIKQEVVLSARSPQDLIKVSQSTSDSTNTVYFYPQGIQGGLEIDPTLSLTTPANQIQIDVTDRYRAIMNTNDTTDYLTLYDRAEDDTSPDATFEFIGPYINEGDAEHHLRYDNTRTTHILESTPTRVRVQVKGCLDTAAGSACLDDGVDDLDVTEEYTFTPDGMFVSNTTDFKASGVALDNTEAEDGYNWMMVESDVTDIAFGEDGFHQGAASFTAGMAKRQTNGPFAAAPIVQNDLNNELTGDKLSVEDIYLNNISGEFDENFDQSQGSVVLWWTPELGTDDSSSTEHYYLFNANNRFFLRYEYDADRFEWRTGTPVSGTQSYSISAGTPYSIVLRWDLDNYLSGTDYSILSVDDNQYAGVTSISSMNVTSLYIGSAGGGTTANGIIEGFTVYRRPLYDGVNGIDVGNGDEIHKINNGGAHTGPNNWANLIDTYQNPIWENDVLIGGTVINETDGSSGTITDNATSTITATLSGGTDNDWDTGDVYMVTGMGGRDPTLFVTGAWDVVFAMPTNSSTGTLGTTGEAWTHPHASNLLPGNSNTGGFMLDGTYTNDGWADEGTPTAVAALATASKIFAGGYYTTSDAANEGIYDEIAVTDGNDYVIRAIAHSDGTGVPQISITGADDAVISGAQMTGTTTSDRDTPDVFIFTFEADTTENIKVKLTNTAASGTVYWHQVEVLANLIDNPSMEGTFSGTPPVPTGWSPVNLDAGDTEKEETIVHSGSSSVQFNATLSSFEQLNQSAGSVDMFYSFGGFGYQGSSTKGLEIKGGGNERWQHRTTYNTESYFRGTGVWNHRSCVMLSDSGAVALSVRGYTGSGNDDRYTDDIYLFQLTDVTLTVTPATETNSTETSGLRIDGDDTATQTISELTTTSGTINFKYTPRHDAADAMKFLDDSGDNVYIAEFYGDANDYIKLYWNAADSITLAYNMNGGGEVTGSAWTTTGITAGTTYEFILTYTGGGNMILDVDGGADEITHATIPAAFGAAPTSAYWGSSQAGENQGDATFAEIATVYYGTGSSETSTTTDTSNWEDTNLYAVFEGAGSYQTGILGISDTGWFDQSGGTDDWFLDYDVSSTTRDRFHARERGTTPTGLHYAKWFFQLQAQADLDTSGERESYINDYQNPDTLSYSTGEDWYNSPSASSGQAPSAASPGLEFDGRGSILFDDASSEFLYIDSTPVTVPPFTMACWYYWDDDLVTSHIAPMCIGDKDVATQYHGIFLYGGSAGDPIRVNSRSIGSNFATTTSGSTVNTWHHACGVFAATDSRSAYIDGGSKGTNTASIEPSGIDRIAIGKRASLTSVSYWSGRLAECAIWNDDLSDAECASLANGASPTSVKPGNLQGYWPLPSTSDITDHAGSYDMTAYNTPADSDSNPLNSVNVGDGTSNTLDFGDTDDFSVEAWIYRDDATSEDTIIAKRNGQAAGDTGYVLWIDETTDDINFEVSDGTDEFLINGTTALGTGQWYHIGAVFDQSDDTACEVYLDGANDTESTTGTIGNVGDLSNAVDFKLGSESDSDATFDGRMDEVRIWGDVRTASEIQDNMNKQVSSTADNLISNWRFNENTGTTAYDETTNDNDGTIGSAEWRTGHVPDQYNEAEGAYTIDAATSSDTNIWWDNNWTKRRKITFDNADQSSNLADFPTLVKLDNTRIDYASTQAAGQDLRFVDADGRTLLKHEIEEFNETGSDYVWVRVPQVDASSTTDYIWMYYGNASASAPPSTWAEETWDDNYQAVWHFDGGALTDSTGNGHTLTAYNTPTSSSGGQMGDYYLFDDASSEYLEIGSVAVSSVPLTMAAWVYTDSTSINQGVVHICDSSAETEYFGLALNGGFPGDPLNFFVRGGGASSYCRTTTAFPTNTWFHACGVAYAVNSYASFINAGSKQTSNTAVTPSGLDKMAIGAFRDSSPSHYMSGGIDEVRISDVARSDDWVTAQHDSQSDTFNTFGSEEDYTTYAPHADQNAGSVVFFDIDGGTYTRHQPAFKIRKWRSTDLPTAVTLEGSTLYYGPSSGYVDSVNYNASLKPITDAYFADELTWYSTMESITSDIGDNVTNNGVSFVAGKYGNGAEINDNEDYLTFNPAGDIDDATGSIEFWFQPKWNHTDSATHYLFRSYDSGSGDDFYAHKDDSNVLHFDIYDNTTGYRWSATSGNYSWSSGDWVHLRFVWDDSLASNQLKVYVDGVEPTHSHANDGSYDAANHTWGANFIIGNSSLAGTAEANGIIDEFMVHDFGDGGDSPDDLAQGGDTGDSDEYLADITNDYTLDFEADDADNRGEYLFLGSDSKFTGANYHLATAGVDSSAVFTWQYWNGTAWSSLTITNEIAGSNNFTTTDGTFYWTQPSDWSLYSVNGSTDLYYIRAHLESGSFTTNPIESFIKTDILLFQYLDDISSNDQTFVITSEPVRLSSGSIQIDVPNRYRMIMETGDTDDYLALYDRAQDDSSPDKVFEIRGARAEEGGTPHQISWNANRITTVLESSSVRARIRVEGKLDSAAGSNYLDDDGADDDIELIEDYTFTTEGVFVSQAWDFKDGLALDNTLFDDGLDWLHISSDETDAAHLDTYLYGDGNTETNIAADGNFADTNKYAVIQAQSTYQDGFVGIQKAGWFDMSGGTDDWYYDVTAAGADVLWGREQNTTPAGKHHTKWFLHLLAQGDLDTENEREAYVNDFRNPDNLSFTTGSEWSDVGPASPGLEFDGSTSYVNLGTGSDLNTYNSDYTVETWVNLDNYNSSSSSIIFGRNTPITGYTLRIGGLTSGDLKKIIFMHWDSGGKANQVGSSDLSLDSWHHIAVTYDVSATTAAIYLDGVSDGGGSLKTQDDAGSYAAVIGIDARDLNGYVWDGLIDEVRVWDDVRTAAEIRENMYKQMSPSSANLVGYWRMNENTGTTTYDETTNNNDGTFVNSPSWTTGFVPDQYNEAEGAYTVDASGSQIELDIDGGSNVSTLVNDAALNAGDTSFTADSTTNFPDGGGSVTYYAYVEGDKFSYTDVNGTVFSGIPSSGELSVVGHADNSVVSLMNRHKPVVKIRKYRENSKPSSVTMEGSGLTEGTDYNVDYVPITDAYFADELIWASTCEASGAWTSPDVGSAGTVGSATFTTGKYGNGIQVDADNEEPYFVSSSNISGTAGMVEFWFKETGVPAATGAFFACDNGSGTINMELARGGNDTDIDFTINDGAAHVNSWDAISVPIYDGEWHHVRLKYDAGTDVPDLYLDNILQTRDAVSAWAAITPQTNTYIGDVSSSDRNIAGVIDELRVYSPLSGGADVLAQGGDTSDSDEYLFSEARDYTLDFDPVDAQSRGEYMFLGADSMFSGVNVDLATIGATGGTLNLVWEYWDGDSWADLESISGFTDGTSQLTQDGAIYWNENPTNWRPYSVNGSTDLYYIRASLKSDSGTYTTDPIENFIKTDILILQYLANVTSVDQTLVVVPEYLWPFLIGIPFLPGLLKKKRRKKK